MQRRTASRFRFPGPLKLILFMASYLLAMIVVSFLLPRRFGKPELAWLTIPILSILFAIILYKVSAKNRPTEYYLEESRYYQMDGTSTLALAESELQISSPRKGTVRLVLPGTFLYKPPDAYAVDSFVADRAESKAGEITLGESWATNVFMRVWSWKSVSFEFVHRFPGSVAQTDHTHLVNSTGVNLDEAMVVTKGTVYLLGALPAGATADLEKARQIPYTDASGHKGISAPPFAYGQQTQALPFSEFGEETAVQQTDSFSLEDIVRDWPKDSDRVFFQTKAVFFGKGKDVTDAARLENLPSHQKSSALYCVTYRDWK